MSPLPNPRPVHPQWSAHYMPLAESMWNAKAVMWVPGSGGGWDPETGPTPAADVKLYEGPVGVSYADTAAGSTDADAAGQNITEAPVKVSMPMHADPVPASGVYVRIVAVTANGDSSLVGRRLIARKVGAEALSLTRTLTCVDDQTNQAGA